jgi:hypothetical protein
MNYVHDSFLSEGNDDYIRFTNIGVDDKFCLIRTLIRNAQRVLAAIHANPNGPSGDVTMDRLIWLMVTMGDLSGRLDREAYMMDGEQYRQVFEYLEGMLEIRFTAEERSNAVVFENAWRFLCIIDDKYRVFVHPGNAHLQPELDALWKEYDELVSTIRRSMDPVPGPWMSRFEDFYFDRGLATARNDIQIILKCLQPYGRKNYAYTRGEERFQKLFKFHGQRPELLEQFALFQDLMVRYIPEYLIETSRRLEAAGPKGFLPNRERIEEVVKGASKTIEYVRNTYVKTETQKDTFDKLCESMNFSN